MREQSDSISMKKIFSKGKKLERQALVAWSRSGNEDS